MLHRKITEHWIWNDPVKLKWWLDILLYVNHEDKKVNIGVKLIECKRGQSVMSLQNWAKRWWVSKSAARNFLELLEKDKMIKIENISISTRITVCGYEDYQRPAHASKTGEDPNNNDNNNIYIYADEKLTSREDIFKKSIEPYLQKYGREMCNDFYMYWTEPNKSKTKLRFEMQKTWDVGRRLVTWSKNNQKYNKPISATQKVSETEYKEF